LFLHNINLTTLFHFIICLYRFILENYYQMKISNMVVASFHPNLERYFAGDAPVRTMNNLFSIDIYCSNCILSYRLWRKR
jgi:hypothetical protein